MEREEKPPVFLKEEDNEAEIFDLYELVFHNPYISTVNSYSTPYGHIFLGHFQFLVLLENVLLIPPINFLESNDFLQHFLW